MKSGIVFVIIVLFFSLFAEPAFSGIPGIDKTKKDSIWADSVLKTLTIDQRIAQLMIIRAYSDRDSAYNDSLASVINTWNPGGICFFKGSPARQALLTNRFQQGVPVKMLVAIDAEWGLGMRLDSAFSFPRPMTLGAVRDDSLVYDVASAVARDCRRIGVNIDFAPVVDVNNNPLNPVINTRSFGEDKRKVAAKGILFMKGLQDHGIVAVAKHFPGHGDTDTDSHLTLPVINKTRQQLDSLELYPFRRLIAEGIDGVMIAHLFVPALDSNANNASNASNAKNITTPTTLSHPVVTALLRNQLDFPGFIITDALDMKGVTKYYKPGEIEVKAFLAGNDILLLPQDLPAAVMAIRQAADSGIIRSTAIDSACRKILGLKHQLHLNRFIPIDTTHLYADLNPVSSEVLDREVYRSAVTLAVNKNNLLPLSFLDHRKIAVISLGDTLKTRFQERLSSYCETTEFNLPSAFTPAMKDSLIKKLTPFNMVILGIHRTSSLPNRQFGVSEQTISLIDTIARMKRTILDIFGSPYILGILKDPALFESIVVSYQDVPESGDISAQAIFGGTAFTGKLPVTASSAIPLNTGIETEKDRLAFVLPEECGIPAGRLKSIDSIAESGIEAKAYPGCQVLFAKDGKIFYQKSFGHPRYEDTVPVRNDMVYDIASLTKVFATTLAVMKLYEEGKINPEATLGDYLKEARGTDKQDLKIRDIMAHQAGLQAWIPFYQRTLKNGKPDPGIYHSDSSAAYPYRVAEGMFIRKDYPDTILAEIIKSPLGSTSQRVNESTESSRSSRSSRSLESSGSLKSLGTIREYKYSDLGFYLLRVIVERLTGEPFDKYLSEQFYRPLGLQKTVFHPLYYFPRSEIIPTENDNTFRHQQIRGDVHDPGAAMLGGVSGHAGLFSDAADLAVILQMLLNGGSYGGKQYFLPSTVTEFTRVQFPQYGNRRGMGFDKPMLNYSPDGPVCESASPESYGHSGFTGTYAWADPKENLIYIFLSNRVYTDAGNNRLAEMNIRTRIHEAMYKAIGSRQ